MDDDTRAAAVRGRPPARRRGPAGDRARRRPRPLRRSSSGRAALLEVEPAERLELLPDLGWALRDTGELEAADAVLGEAVEEAKRRGDEPAELRAEIQRARVGFMRSAGDPEYSARRRATGDRPCSSALAATPTSRTPGSSWASPSSSAGDRGAQLEALLHAREHAVASGDTRREIEAWNEVGGAMLFGRTPVRRGAGVPGRGARVGATSEGSRPSRRMHCSAARTSMRGSASSTRPATGSSARRRSAASSASPTGWRRRTWPARRWSCSPATRTPPSGSCATASTVAERDGRAARYVALYRSQLAHILARAGPGSTDASAELEQARELYAGLPVWQMRARAGARASRRDGGGGRARAGGRPTPWPPATTSPRAP